MSRQAFWTGRVVPGGNTRNFIDVGGGTGNDGVSVTIPPINVNIGGGGGVSTTSTFRPQATRPTLPVPPGPTGMVTAGCGCITPSGTRGRYVVDSCSGQVVCKRRRRRMNPLNPRALNRALRRVKGFNNFVKRSQKTLRAVCR